MKKAIVYARCSTDESRQDVEIQLVELRSYCERQGWEYDEVSEYASGSKSIPEKLSLVLEAVFRRKYDVMIVHSMDRFSRLVPSTTEKLLNQIVESNCRFISMQENLDSDNKMLWYSMKGMWLYFSNLYSVKLSEKVKLGMKRAAEKGKHCGRPKGAKDKKQRSKKGYYNKGLKSRLKL